MSERKETFQMAGSARLVLRIPSGEVRLVAGPPGEVMVRCRGEERHLSRLAIDREGDTINVGPEGSGFGHWPSLDVEIAVGAPPEVRARFGSADLAARTGVGSLEVAGASGDVTLDSIEGPMTVRLASGDLEVGSVGGRADVVTASGRVRVKEVGGAADVKAVSGDVVLGSVAGDCTLRTASGRVILGHFGGSRCQAKTVSGDVRVGVPSGRRYSLSLQTLSGDVRTDFPVSGEGAAAPARISVTSVSGDIRITAAEG
jgi:DUF4097 and DUF4098 domain-containing protein YvlB